MKDFDNRLNVVWWALRIGLGVGPIITGIDKYFNKLADWEMYLSPLTTKVIPGECNDLHARHWCGGNCRRAGHSQPLDQTWKLHRHVG